MKSAETSLSQNTAPVNGKPTLPGRGGREIDMLTALAAVVDLIDNELPAMTSAGDIKAALVIWRKTHGWGLAVEEIGITELARRTQTNADNLRRRLPAVCSALGIKTEARVGETKAGNAIHLRKRYRWPVNDRVRKNLEKASGGWGYTYPEGGGTATRTPPGTGAPTQSSTSHHQNSVNENPSPAPSRKGHARPSSPNREATQKPFSKNADDENPQPRKPIENPVLEFEARMQERHGPVVNAAAVLADVREELGDTPLAEFLDVDAKTTTAPSRLTNPHGHYRKLAQKVGRSKAREIADTADRALRSVAVQERPHTAVCRACKDGLTRDGGYCSCVLGPFRRQVDERSVKQKPPTSAPGATNRAALGATA
jgi:hypothetical protein